MTNEEIEKRLKSIDKNLARSWDVYNRDISNQAGKCPYCNYYSNKGHDVDCIYFIIPKALRLIAEKDKQLAKIKYRLRKIKYVKRIK